MFTIKTYKKDFYPILKAWWETVNIPPNPVELIPEQSTYLLYYKDVPILSVSLLFIEGITEFCIIENFVGNPDFKGPIRREGTKILLKYIKQVAKQRQLKRMLCMTNNPALQEYYKYLGFTNVIQDIQSFVINL